MLLSMVPVVKVVRAPRNNASLAHTGHALVTVVRMDLATRLQASVPAMPSRELITMV